MQEYNITTTIIILYLLYNYNDYFYSCELPKSHSEQNINASEKSSSLPSLDAWEIWLVKKAKEDRLRLQKKAEEVGRC